jgi:hypothetical protein
LGISKVEAARRTVWRRAWQQRYEWAAKAASKRAEAHRLDLIARAFVDENIPVKARDAVEEFRAQNDDARSFQVEEHQKVYDSTLGERDVEALELEAKRLATRLEPKCRPAANRG